MADSRTIGESCSTKQAYVREEVDRVNENFEKHETIKQFRLVPKEFTEENDMLTPTMKKKRRIILNRFDDRVDEIYAPE
ncbi:hypothetical protein EL22_26800 [Halostagnicola sp. A56]|nr:hypothetical protein [Halostagnicola sp. A56]KMT45886.1 hypothetical protein EL22_26800 [Halostagnicola sp. A56]